MNRTLLRKARLLAGVAAAAASAACASALDFTFSQDGFAEGATVSGSFSGEDGDGNGWLSHFPIDGISELSAFSLSFSGNSLIGTFTMDLSNLVGFAFFLDGDSILGNDFDPELVPDLYTLEGIYAFDGPVSFAAGLGTLPDGGGDLFNEETFEFDVSAVNPRVSGASSVPDGGATSAMLAMSTLGLVIFRRRMTGKK